MYIASMDIKTALEVARPRQIATILGEQDTHGQITAALLSKMGSLTGHVTFEHLNGKNVEDHDPKASGTRKHGKWDGGKKDNGCSGCGVVIKPVDMESCVATSKIAAPSKVSTDMATEIAGVHILTEVRVCISKKEMTMPTVFKYTQQIVRCEKSIRWKR